MISDTIYALSSGRLPAAIAVVRISGPAALDAAAALVGGVPVPRRASLRRLRDADGATLDHALVLTFPGPASATGEDLVELHLHGGRAVVAAVETALARSGLRRAEAGEFTRRALTHGRIDLAEAEGLADLLAAETEAQRRIALGASEGLLSRRIGDWLDRLVGLAVRVEAQVDYSDEGDVAADETLSGVTREIGVVRGEIDAVLARPTVDRLRDGYRVVLAGPPNSGKSTLLNLLAGREAAIVSPIAGTTRDRIEVPVTRSGVPYVLTDTAGLVAETTDAIEAIGVWLSHDAIAGADVVLWLGDDAGEGLLVHARRDQPGRAEVPEGRLGVARDDAAAVERLWNAIEGRVSALLPIPDLPALNARQHGLCLEARGALDEAEHLADWLIVAESLRRCRVTLAGIVGQNATERLLDDLFQRFCIGK